MKTTFRLNNWLLLTELNSLVMCLIKILRNVEPETTLKNELVLLRNIKQGRIRKAK
jgi:hypothetical protein